MPKPDDDLVRELITNLKLSNNKIWFQIKNDVHHTIMSSDVPFINYLIINNKKGSDIINAYDINIAFGDIFVASVLISESNFNEFVLASYKTRYQLSDFNDIINFKVVKYYNPFQIKKSIVAFMNNQRVFRVIYKYIFHFNQTDDNYWVPSMMGEIDSENKVSYFSNFDFNGLTLLSRIGNKTIYVHDAINNFETNHVDFINSKLLVKLMTGFVENNILIELTTEGLSTRTVSDANSTTNLKISEYDAIPYIVKVLKNVENNKGEVIQYAIWDPKKNKGFINSFLFNVDTHNFNFQNKNKEINIDTWNLIKDLPDGNILINDLRY